MAMAILTWLLVITGMFNRVYLNQNGTLEVASTWSSDGIEGTKSIAWGDVDGDGDLDLAAGNSSANKLYLNENGILQTTAAWHSDDTDFTEEITWGDVDGDGDLDLAVANNGAISEKVYLNHGGILQTTAGWNSVDASITHSLAWGDVDGDGDLDLVTGHSQSTKKMYLNLGGVLQTISSWTSEDADATYSIAWGDVDGDGDLDLAAGNLGAANKVYLNQGGVLQAAASWTSADADDTHSIAWGDVDGDGDLDLAVGNAGAANKVYLNQGGLLQTTAAWSSDDTSSTRSLAWGDVDGDGDLDLAVGNSGAANKVYLNQGGVLQTTADWSSDDASSTRSVAWGDMDDDGDLDLAASNWNTPNRVYLNNGGELQSVAAWVSEDNDETSSIAWGDVDGDGTLDLAVGNWYKPNKIYLNEGGVLQTVASWNSGDADSTRNVAWGDVDGDGDLDLAAGNSTFQANKVYLNQEGILQTLFVWRLDDTDDTRAVAWGDMDGDGDLDLVAGYNGAANRIYLSGHQGSHSLNNNPPFLTVQRPITPATTYFYGPPPLLTQNVIPISYTLSDFEGDAIGNLSAFYSFDGGGQWFPALSTSGTSTTHLPVNIPLPSLPTISRSPSLTLTSQSSITDTLFIRSQATISDLAIALSVTHSWVGDLIVTLEHVDTGTNITLIDRPGIPATQFGCDGNDLSVTLADDADSSVEDECTASVPTIHGYFRPNNPLAAFSGEKLGGQWKLTVIDEAISDDGTLISWQLLPSTHSPASGVFYWDTFKSGFFGRSNNVVMRFVASPQPATSSTNGTFQYFDQTPGLFQRPYASSTTFPFQVRGTQVRVLSDTLPVAGALVYRLPYGKSTGALSIVNSNSGLPYLTDMDGYLQGHGQLGLGDQLLALLPITATESYTIYYSSAIPTSTGLDMFTVDQPGVQELIVSNENPLILFNLYVSLEWDAREDIAYLEQLQGDMELASQQLFDVTNGQVALGQVRIYHARQNWLTSDVRIYASNTIRPNADVGGFITRPISDTQLISSSQIITNAYLPGQVRMPATWIRTGEPSGEPNLDWPYAFAHELAHYFLFQLDNYLGIDNNQLIQPDCDGSFMSDAYREEYSEFLTRPEWDSDPDCLQTVAQYTTGRSDWQTIKAFFPMLSDPTTDPGGYNDGPSSLPLAVTQVEFISPEDQENFLAFPEYELLRADGSPLPVSSAQIQGYLIQTQGTLTLTDDAIISVGSPVVGQLLARGAREGDRICVLDNSQIIRRVGCLDDLSDTSTNSVVLYDLPGWQPKVDFRPISVTLDSTTTQPLTTTVSLTVTQEYVSGTLYAQFYPAPTFLSNLTVTAPVIEMIPVGNNIFTQTVILDVPTFEGFIRIWESGTEREEIIPLYLGGGWGPNDYGWGPNDYGWGPNDYGWGVGRRGWGAPVTSANGQVTLFDFDQVLGLPPPYVLQQVTSLPNLPVWFTLVGQGVQITSPEVLTGSKSILFHYLQRNVPNEPLEGQLRIIYSSDEGHSWHELDTILDTGRNLASAQFPGEGLYALVATFEVETLVPGWNNIPYPVVTNRPVSIALASLEDNYTSVYRHVPGANWELSDTTVQAPFEPLVNTLLTMTLDTYWIQATVTNTLFVRVDDNASTILPNFQRSLALPPMTVYGWITPTNNFSAQAGMSVTAWIGNQLCGQTNIVELEGKLAYVLQVKGWSYLNGSSPCGLEGAIVSFRVGIQPLETALVWDNTQARYYPLYWPNSDKLMLFLPIIMNG